MMPTTPVPNVEEAAAAHAEVVDRIAHAKSVKPLELLEAEAAVRIAEHRDAAKLQAAENAAEADRLRQIRDLYVSLTNGDHSRQAAAVAERYDVAVAALAALVEETRVLLAMSEGAARRLAALGEIPEDVRIELTGRAARGDLQLIVDGRTWPSDPRQPAQLLAGAVKAAAGGSLVQLRQAVAGSAGPPIDRIRRLAGQPVPE